MTNTSEIPTQDIFENISKTANEAESSIQDILDRVCPKSLLSALMAQTFIVSIDTNVEIHSERNPIFILELLATLILKRDNYGTDTTVTQKLLEETSELLKKYSLKNMKNYQGSGSFIGHIKNQFQTVRGNFFFFQAKNRLEHVYAKYDSFFEKVCGISPTRFLNFIMSFPRVLDSIMESEYKNFCFTEDFARIVSNISEYNGKVILKHDSGENVTFNNHEEAQSYIRDFVINNFVAKKLIISPENLADFCLTNDEFEAIKNLIGLSKNSVERFYLSKNYPLCVFDDGTALLLANYTSLDSVINAYEKVARQDSKFYERFQKSKSKYTEDSAYALLTKIFSDDCVYRSLLYDDPDKDEKSKAELDLAVKHGNFLILCEVKSRQIREEALAGDAGRLRSDIKSNIADAHSQALRAIKYIKSVDESVFVEKNSDKKLKIRQDKIDKIFVVSIAYEALADIGTRINKVSEFGLFSDGQYPFSISLPDLEVISLTSISPETFLHYMQQRLAAINDNAEWIGDELDLFGAYIDCRLIKKNLPLPDDDKPFNMLAFSGYANDVFSPLDDLSCNQNDFLSSIRLRVHPQILSLFETFQEKSDAASKFILYKLHNLPDEVLHKVTSGVFQAHGQSIPQGICRKINIQHEDIIICIAVTQFESLDNLLKYSMVKLILEKYRSKSNTAIVFAVNTDSKSLFESVEYLESAWEYDPVIEETLEKESEQPLQIYGKRPGRNSPCPCGSGKKFKKCCLGRIGIPFAIPKEE